MDGAAGTRILMLACSTVPQTLENLDMTMGVHTVNLCSPSGDGHRAAN